MGYNPPFARPSREVPARTNSGTARSPDGCVNGQRKRPIERGSQCLRAGSRALEKNKT